MSKILKDLHKYVLTLPKEGELTLPNGGTVPFDNTTIWEVLCGGDQLNVIGMRSVKQLRLGHETAAERFDAITPVIEDWHVRVTLLVVSASSMHMYTFIPASLIPAEKCDLSECIP